MLGLIEEALNEAEQQAAESNPEPEEQSNEEAGVGPCETQEEGEPTVSDEENPA